MERMNVEMNDSIMRIVFIIREYLKNEFDNFPMSCCFESSLVAKKYLLN